jgi:hypothetical protein
MPGDDESSADVADVDETGARWHGNRTRRRPEETPEGRHDVTTDAMRPTRRALRTARRASARVLKPLASVRPANVRSSHAVPTRPRTRRGEPTYATVKDLT